ncbi:MAG: aminomethyl transferase family protein, partial [Gammaproteobacteria bacterium]|nr:aminomethyl transferase family protein [Gammaproteobacteria bacterium]
HDYVAREARAVREAVGAVEIANFAKHRLTGPDARAFLDATLAGFIPKPGRISLTPLLTPKGRLYGDLTVSCLSEDRFMLFGSGAFQMAHRRLFEDLLRDGGHDVRYENVSGQYHGIGLSGPNSRALLERICRDDVGPGALRFRDIRETYVGGVPTILIRLSFSGELGYEIYVEPEYQLKLFEEIEAAGADLGLRWYGARALMSMRLEKGWGAWGLDYRPDFTAAESGLDAFINWDKDFIGKAAALEQRNAGPERRLVTLSIDTDIDVSNDEAILKDGECVGYVTSGGYAHHLGISMALGYVPSRLARDGESLEVEINGVMYPSRIHAEPLYDPRGERMKS